MRMSNISTWESLPAFRLLHRVSLRSFSCTGSVPRAFTDIVEIATHLPSAKLKRADPFRPYIRLFQRGNTSHQENASRDIKCVAVALDMTSLTMLRSAALKRAIDCIAHQTKGAPNSAAQACNSVFRATSMKRRWYRISEASSAISCQSSCENCPP